MVPVMSLWLPILLSAVIVFVASSVIHMVLPYHRGDFKKLPDEDSVMDAFRKFAGATAFVGYALGLWQNTIWYGRAWTTTLKTNIDGLIYALLSGGVFGWLWPK